MGRKGVEVRVQQADVDRHVGHRLGPVDQDRDPLGVGPADQLAHRIDRPQHVAHVGDREEASWWLQEPGGRLRVEAPVRSYRDELQLAAGLVADLLPGHQVGVMLHLGADDPVAGTQPFTGEGLGHEIDPLGGVAHEHHPPGIGPHQPRHRHPRPFEDLGRALAQDVDPTMHVGVGVAVVI